MKVYKIFGKTYKPLKRLESENVEISFFDILPWEAVKEIKKKGEKISPNEELGEISQKDCFFCNQYCVFEYEDLMGGFNYILLKEVKE